MNHDFISILPFKQGNFALSEKKEIILLYRKTTFTTYLSIMLNHDLYFTDKQ